MQLMAARGLISEGLFGYLRGGSGDALARLSATAGEQGDPVAVLTDEDLQISLWALYELHYRGFDDVDDGLEWDPELLAVRARLEKGFERALRDLTAPHIEAAKERTETFEDTLVSVIEDVDGPSVASYVQREATREQYLEFLMLRSIYHLKESDPHAFVIPRISGAPKVALAELQYDEFGSGRPEMLHQELFARTLEGAGLEPEYGTYIDLVPASTLAVNNVMSFFALHRRLRGAAMGHLAAFETTSSIPCRRYAQGANRLGFPDDVAAYFDEHVEADAVHEHVAQRDICGALVAEDERLAEDVLLGAAACIHVDNVVGEELLSTWQNGGSALRATAGAAA